MLERSVRHGRMDGFSRVAFRRKERSLEGEEPGEEEEEEEEEEEAACTSAVSGTGNTPFSFHDPAAASCLQRFPSPDQHRQVVSQKATVTDPHLQSERSGHSMDCLAARYRRCRLRHAASVNISNTSSDGTAEAQEADFGNQSNVCYCGAAGADVDPVPAMPPRQMCFVVAKGEKNETDGGERGGSEQRSDEWSVDVIERQGRCLSGSIFSFFTQECEFRQSVTVLSGAGTSSVSEA
ncbi:unnamed protein product [Pleuronectes platessa]|uniref:Uncharacterized protein n=1 Tax=Pleuronectes platessa TaxID=8262 RepID=A0A9N7V775_PLEPL|nr:unnamed protein product [Pleuronectes platessa]